MGETHRGTRTRALFPRPFLLSAVFALLSTLLLAEIVPRYAPGLLRFDHMMGDVRIAFLSDRLPSQHPGVAIVSITDETLKDNKVRQPIDRALLARTVEAVDAAGAQVIGIDPSATNIAAAKLHADKGHLSIDYRCTTVEEMDHRERFDVVLAMEVVEHVADVGMFLGHCAAMLKPGGLMVVSTLNRNWKSFALAIVGAEYVLRWLPRGTHEWNKFVTPDELARHLAASKLAITEETGVVYSPFADKWSLSADMDVNYMVVAEGM